MTNNVVELKLKTLEPKHQLIRDVVYGEALAKRLRQSLLNFMSEQDLPVESPAVGMGVGQLAASISELHRDSILSYFDLDRVQSISEARLRRDAVPGDSDKLLELLLGVVSEAGALRETDAILAIYDFVMILSEDDPSFRKRIAEMLLEG